MKRREMQNLIKLLGIGFTVSMMFNIPLMVERYKYEEAFEENLQLNYLFQAVHDVNNYATFKHYEEVKEGLKYRVVLNDGSYALIDREGETYTIHLKDLKYAPTSYEGETALIKALESYIEAHKRNRFK